MVGVGVRDSDMGGGGGGVRMAEGAIRSCTAFTSVFGAKSYAALEMSVSLMWCVQNEVFKSQRCPRISVSLMWCVQNEVFKSQRCP